MNSTGIEGDKSLISERIKWNFQGPAQKEEIHVRALDEGLSTINFSLKEAAKQQQPKKQKKTSKMAATFV